MRRSCWTLLQRVARLILHMVLYQASRLHVTELMAEIKLDEKHAKIFSDDILTQGRGWPGSILWRAVPFPPPPPRTAVAQLGSGGPLPEQPT